MAMSTAISTGNTILQKAFLEGVDITPMKLQKLVYCLYKAMYKRTKHPLFDERFEAWKYGPVLPSIYDAFKQYGSNAIRDYARDYEGRIFVIDEESSNEFRECLNETWAKYKGYDGLVLSAFTHKSDTAWRKAIDARRTYLDDQDIDMEEDFV